MSPFPQSKTTNHVQTTSNVQFVSDTEPLTKSINVEPVSRQLVNKWGEWQIEIVAGVGTVTSRADGVVKVNVEWDENDLKVD